MRAPRTLARPPAGGQRTRRRPAARIDQVHQRERGDGELRHDQQRAGRVDPPQHRLPVRRRRPGRLVGPRGRPRRSGSRTSTTTSAAATRQNPPSERQRHSRPAGAQSGQRRGRQRYAQRLRALPDAHGQAALVPGEPAEDEPAAGREHRAARRSGQRQATSQPGIAVHRPARRSARCRPAPSPVASTTRSPRRSATAPQPISVSSSPIVGQATRKLASTSENPSCRSAGIR